VVAGYVAVRARVPQKQGLKHVDEDIELWVAYVESGREFHKNKD